MTQSIANDLAVDIFISLDPTTIALLLDVDGTLIDIGPSPFDVQVSDGLRASLARLYELSGGAVALVSGRPIRDLDRLFTPLKLPAIGGHGAEMRLRDGQPISRIDDLPVGLRKHLADAATPDSGVIAEDKGYSLALHFRKAPQEEVRLREHIAAGRTAFPGEATEVLPGKAMFEVKRPGISKGEAVRDLMTHTPFAGRMPVFVGDDVTDQSAFAVMQEMGGKGFAVGAQFAETVGTFESPAEVRLALQKLAEHGEVRRS